MGYTAIFGGTFNPLHIGHYEMLTALENDSNVEKILIMPDRIPPHKVCDFMAGDDVRIEMCRIATKSFSKAELCLIEFERTGKSYSYDTVVLLKSIYPEKKLAFVCGGDMLVTFDGWYRYQELMKLLPFIVFKRADIDIDVFNKAAQKFSSMGMKLIIKDEVITNVSSTEIRNNFTAARNLIPPPVYSYLITRGVYSE